MYRLGSKERISDLIISYFPDHSIYIEPFFGIGGIYFNKKNLASINLLNDFDSNIHNLYLQLQNNSSNLIEELLKTPITEDTFNYLKSLKTDDVCLKAIKFIYLSSFSLYGKGSSLMTGNIVKKESIIEKLESFLKGKHLQQATFYKKDFRAFLASLSFVQNQIPRIFIYNDPPYLHKLNNYETPKWEINDLKDLIEGCLKLNVKFAISEFKSVETLDIFSKYNLNIIEITKRHNIKKLDTEILATNYTVKYRF